MEITALCPGEEDRKKLAQQPGVWAIVHLLPFRAYWGGGEANGGGVSKEMCIECGRVTDGAMTFDPSTSCTWGVGVHGGKGARKKERGLSPVVYWQVTRSIVREEPAPVCFLFSFCVFLLIFVP